MKRKYTNPMREKLRNKRRPNFMFQVADYLWGDGVTSFREKYSCTTGHEGAE